MPNPTIPNFPPQGIQAQLDLLYLYNPDAANKLIEQLNAGLADMEAFKKELEKALQDLQGVLRYKGSVETETDLPAEGNVIGDVWNITSTDENVAWDGTKWDKFGSAVDTAVFLTKTDAANTYLPLAGGQITGALSFATASGTKNGQIQAARGGLEVTGDVLFDGSPAPIGSYRRSLGNTFNVWQTVYTNQIYNGDYIGVPRKAGTLALLEDIEVTSVNGKKGDVTLTGADIQATLSGTGAPVTATVTEHLQTLKNDESALGEQVSTIEEKIPEKASATNQLATMEDIPSDSGLPDQTGHTGFLQTDGTNATWSDKEALTNNSNSNFGVAIGPNAQGGSGVAIGERASILRGALASGTAIGRGAQVTSMSGGTAIGEGATADQYAIAIGSSTDGGAAKASARCAIQIGNAENTEDHSLYVSFNSLGEAIGNYKLLGKDGAIPSERLATAGTTGQVLSKTDTGMAWVDAGGGSGGTDDNGLEGDYATRYGIVDETVSGLPSIITGNQVKIPAGLVLDVPGVQGLTTNASNITYDIQSTINCTLFLANGEVLEATDVFFQTSEPEDGTTGYAAWWNGTEWKFKSNDTGNVWRAANAVRIAKCIFTDGSLTRLCFTGCRLLNKQQFLSKNGGDLPGAINFTGEGSAGASVLKWNGHNRISFRNETGPRFHYGTSGTAVCGITYTGLVPENNGAFDLGNVVSSWRTLYVNRINNGANIAIPTTGGTMVVATPPTETGTYTLKLTVAADGTVTTTWVKDA